MSKSDYLAIAKMRKITADEAGNPLTWSKILALNMSNLVRLVGDFSIDEQAYLTTLEHKRKEFSSKEYKLDKLKSIAKKYCICPLPTSKAAIIDEIIMARDAGANYVELDEYQLQVVNDITKTNGREFYIKSAGPGCGKSTTICAIVAAAIEMGQNILIVSYNRNSKDLLKMYTTKFISSKIICTKTSDLELPGVHIHTLCELISPSVITDDINELEEIPSSSLLQNVNFDYVLIDEAQDISDKYIKLVQSLIKSASTFVVFYDMRQQLYGNVTWIKPATHTLPYNHRSSSRVIELLNSYSGDKFKLDHIKQTIAPAPASASASGDKPAERGIVEQLQSLEHIIDIIKQNKRVFIVAPISFDKFGYAAVKKYLLDLIYSAMPGTNINTLSSNQQILDSNIVICNSKQIKGFECDVVVLIKLPIQYEKYLEDITPEVVDKAIFVAMSRAKSKVYLFEDAFIPETPVVGTGKTNKIMLERSLRSVNIPEQFTNYEDYVVYTAINNINERIELKKEFIAPTIISVDIETNDKFITEIGIIIYRNGEIITKTSLLSQGVKPLMPKAESAAHSSYFDVEALTALKVINIVKLMEYQASITEEFMRFIDPYTQSPYKIIYWGGNELVRLGIEDHKHLDMSMYYKAWLELNDKKRNSGISLGDAVRDLFGYHFDFEYHRALTDATALLGVALCISNLRM
jgi:hypothetical protein